MNGSTHVDNILFRSRTILGSRIRLPTLPRRSSSTIRTLGPAAWPRPKSPASARCKGFWRWTLIVATALTIFLCINQQFALRFFVGYTQLNTEYFYLLIALMLPFTFLIFPATNTAPLDRIPWYDMALFVITFGASIYLMQFIRAAASNGWEFGGAPQGVIVAGVIMWVVLMEALRRTGGWSLLLSVLPFTVYPLFADAEMARAVPGHRNPTLDLATSYHVLSGESLLGIPVQAFADTVIGFLVFGTALMMTGAGKFFINISFAACGTFRGGAAKVCIFASGLLGMMSAASIISNVLTAGTMTIPTMKKTGFRASYAAAIEACASTGAVLAPPVMGATAFVIAQFLNVSYAEVAARRDHSRGPLLRRPVHAGRRLRRPAQPQGSAARRAAARVGYDQGRLVLRLRDRAPDRHAAATSSARATRRSTRPLLSSCIMVGLAWKRQHAIFFSNETTDAGHAVLWGMCICG